MRIAVVDGQGGGIGRAVVEKIRKELQAEVEIVALGTNATATSVMLKAGADEGATGENAILVNVKRVDIIAGVLGIISANSMLGELSPQMALAIADSPALKLLLPLNRCNIEVVGSDKNTPLPALIAELVESIRSKLEQSPR